MCSIHALYEMMFASKENVSSRRDFFQSFPDVVRVNYLIIAARTQAWSENDWRVRLIRRYFVLIMLNFSNFGNSFSRVLLYSEVIRRNNILFWFRLVIVWKIARKIASDSRRSYVVLRTLHAYITLRI